MSLWARSQQSQKPSEYLKCNFNLDFSLVSYIFFNKPPFFGLLDLPFDRFKCGIACVCISACVALKRTI